MEWKLVIFDLDGTLVNSIDGIAFSMNHVLQRHGLPIHSTEVYKTFVGNGIKELVRLSLPIHRSNSGLLDQYFIEMKDVYFKKWDYNMHAYPGIPELLDYLGKNGFYLAVNTNKDEALSRDIMNRFFPDVHFSYLVGGDTLERNKPNPMGAILIAKSLGVLPQQCIYIGDSEVDMMTAKNAKMYSVGVLWGFRKETDLLRAGAQSIIKKPGELLGIIH